MADVKDDKDPDIDLTREKYGISPEGSNIADECAEINEKSLLRKLDYKLLPPLTILYLLSFLDRSNGISEPFGNPLPMLIYAFPSSWQCPSRRPDGRYWHEYDCSQLTRMMILMDMTYRWK